MMTPHTLDKIDRLWLTAAFVVSLAFGIVSILPNVWQRFDSMHPFQGIEMMGTDQEFYYAARVREVADGDWAVSNAYRETKNVPTLQPSLPEWTIAMGGRLIGLGPVDAFIYSKFVFGFLLSVVFIGFFASLTQRLWPTLLAVAILLFVGTLLGAPWDLFHLFSRQSTFDSLRYARPINPQWIVTWFFGFLWLLSEWLRKPYPWHIPTITLCVIVTLYSNFYGWSYALVIMGLLLCWFLWRRDRMRLRDIAIFFLCFGIFSIPYIIHLHTLIGFPSYSETAMRLGLVHRRTPIVGFWALLFLPSSYIANRMFRQTKPLVSVLAIGGLIVLNQQLITGMYLVPHHYHWYFIQALSSITVMSIIFSLLPFSRRYMQVGGFVLLLLAISFASVTQVRSYGAVADEWGAMQRDMPLLQFIEQRVPLGTVIFASERNTLLADLIVIYTPADVYSGSNANAFLTSDDRARASYFFDLWLRGTSPEMVQLKFPREWRSTLSSRLHSIYYRELSGDYGAIPDKEVIENIEAYHRYYTLSLKQKLHLYPLQYILFGPADEMNAQWDALFHSSEKVYDHDGFILLRLPSS